MAHQAAAGRGRGKGGGAARDGGHDAGELKIVTLGTSGSAPWS
jgi:hypothetical protein